MTVWFTNSMTTAWLSVTDVDVAAGTVAAADICFLLCSRDHHVVGQRRVGVQERTGQSAPRGFEVFLHSVGPVGQQRDGAVGGGPHGFRADHLSVPDRGVLPLQKARG